MTGSKLLSQLNDRSREVFRRVVEGYLLSGDPIGSRTLSREMSAQISAATVRNVMQDLEYLGLLGSPHVSAGRVPTQLGLRLFVDGLMEVGTVAPADRDRIEAQLSEDADVNTVLDRVGAALSGITQGASLVLMPKHEAPIRHIEFVSLGPERALVVLVFSDGQVENRIFTPPPGQTPSSMREAANFLNALAEGRTLSALGQEMRVQIANRQQELDQLARELVESGMAIWEEDEGNRERLIVRGQANLLGEVADMERIRTLFEDLERKRDIADFLELTEDGEGVRIFIGSENKLFSLSGSSLVVSPYMNADRKIIGAIGVIGPTRLNYGRIVPIVDYTAQLVGRIVSDRGKGVEMSEEKFEDTGESVAADPLAEELAAVRQERDDFRDRFMRALADAENIRKRGERDRREAEQYGGSRFARDMLPVYDALRRAVDAVGDQQRESASALIEGVELTLRELGNIFSKHGITVISPAVGETFDPQLHQAMFEAPVPGIPGGGIIQVMSEGFLLHDRLLRPAQVGVSSSPVSKAN